MVKTITTYETSDGEIHNTKDTANKAQAYIDLIAFLSSEGSTEDHAEDLTQALTENALFVMRMLEHFTDSFVIGN